MREVPIGIYDFSLIRKDSLLFVDKTSQLENLIADGRRYFFARPDGVGKSLLLSTLSAMFRGKAELFSGLAAEEWVISQAKHPAPVITLDFSSLNTRTAALFEHSLQKRIRSQAQHYAVTVESETLEDTLYDIIQELYDSFGELVVLIDNYDKPVLDCLKNTPGIHH